MRVWAVVLPGAGREGWALQGSQSEEQFGDWLSTGVSVHPWESGRLWGRCCPEGGGRLGTELRRPASILAGLGPRRVSYWGSLVSVSP